MAPRKKTLVFGDNQVSAGGVLFYRYNDHDIAEILLSYNRGWLEDLGGRVDSDDKNIYQTAAREVGEESNHKISTESTLRRIKSAKFITTVRSKYVLFIVPANEYEAKLEQEDFGDREIHDGFDRTIQWVPIHMFLHPSTPKNYRLRNKELNEVLKNLHYSMPLVKGA